MSGLRGIAASFGVVVGRAVGLPRSGRAPRRFVADVEAEAGRLRQALEASRASLERARDELVDGAPEAAPLLDAPLLMHGDALFLDAALEILRSERVNAEHAVDRAVQQLRAPLDHAASPYLRERAEDVAQMGFEVVRHLGGAQAAPALGSGSVIVAEELGAADAARLLLDPRVVGLVTEGGSATNHTAILARALGVPAVVGVRGAVDAAVEGERVVVDGLAGRVEFAPGPEAVAEAEARAAHHEALSKALEERESEEARSRDGVSVTVLANIEIPEEASAALAHGAEGVGLYRTEFLFLDRSEVPDEATQRAAYTEVAARLAPRPVVLRTLDIGGDKLPTSLGLPPSPNPALGLRSLRLSLRRPELLRTQLRAMLAAATAGKVDVLFPMVSGVDELRQAKALLAAVRAELEADGAPVGPVRVGCLFEVPAAALVADRILEEVDFACVGTNDLVQYALAVDRSNPDVAHHAQALDPGVLALLAHIVRAAHEAGRALTMCGEMAADPLALPVVLGLGFRSLSVPVTSLPLVRELVRRVDIGELEALAADARGAATAWTVRRLVKERLGDRLGELLELRGL
ncbi:MAG: phosphoenolpyruvate--protein phosphotransferase [Myxococcota bacterium]